MIKNKIQSKVAKAFDKKLADAVDTFTCEKPIYSGKYNPVTQTYPITESKTYSGRGALFGSYQKDLVKPADYQAEDAKAIVLQSEVAAVPQIDDIWVTNKGDFKVVNIGADPTSSVWVCQLRKVGT